MASLEDLYENDSKDDQSEEEEEDSSCSPMCQQMRLIEHPLSTISLSRSLTDNINNHNIENRRLSRPECSR